MKLRTITEVEINLHDKPFHQWPAEARDLARNVLMGQRNRDAYLQQLPECRKSWLIAKMEATEALLQEFTDLLDVRR